MSMPLKGYGTGIPTLWFSELLSDRKYDMQVSHFHLRQAQTIDIS